MSATPEELAKYRFRADEYADLATYLRRIALSDLLDKQVVATAGTFALECDELTTRWAAETQSGL